MNKRSIAVVTLFAFLNATFAWSANDRYLIDPNVLAERKIAEVCVSQGVGYSARVECLAFDANGARYDIESGTIRGVDTNGDVREFVIEEVAAVKLPSLRSVKTSYVTLSLEALRAGPD